MSILILDETLPVRWFSIASKLEICLSNLFTRGIRRGRKPRGLNLSAPPAAIVGQASPIQLVGTKRASPFVKTDVRNSMLFARTQRTPRTGEASVEDVHTVEGAPGLEERLYSLVAAYRCL